MLSAALSNLASKGPAWNQGLLHTVRDMIHAGVTCGEKWDGQDSVEMEILGVCPGWALL